LCLILVPFFPFKDILLASPFPFRPYLMASGLFQGKGVFVPHPHVYNVRLSAQLKYPDGTTAVWRNIEMQDLSLAERYRKDKYRLWERKTTDTDRPMMWWPDAAKWIAGQAKLKGQLPIEIILLRHRKDSPAPGETDSNKEIVDVLCRYQLSSEAKK
ncbi:MAG: hypothetical protein K2X27_28505, partial [Candidatus Obscuribacterales bacterium]|nr:hypothetical protein [Candidatus Obscuribacterales bacterium]